MRRPAAAFLFFFAVALTFAFAAKPARAADDPDPWLGKDKALHFGVSAGIAAGGYAAGAAIFDARGHALLFGGGIAAACGIAKETADLAGFGDPSWKDLTWDGIGIVVGLAVAWGVDLLIRGLDSAHPALERGRTGIAF
jgi:putative lipoprotein